MIDWNSDESEILINPRCTVEDQLQYKKILGSTKYLSSHIWVSTSGSTSVKWVGLSKKAILASAQAVNFHLNSDSKDIWIHALPNFHVGGLGIWARGYLSGSLVIDFKNQPSYKWHASDFYQYLIEKKGTLTALVPTQLHDLIQLGLKSPPALRAVIIGGGSLGSDIYFKAIELGWKVLPSYGMTECASQVATAELGSWEKNECPLYKVLKHVSVDQDPTGRLRFKGESLLSLYALCVNDKIELIDPKLDGWFVSEDRGSVEGTYLTVAGRFDHMIKIGGESVELGKLEELLQKIRRESLIEFDVTLVTPKDVRLGHSIHLVVTGSIKQGEIVMNQFNNRVLPFERIRATHCVSMIPRSSLGKVLKNDLEKILKEF
ncbi:MAG: AMP-binding protein [Parachlamydiaceae bacterium]|nr:AMP-binding protein [Parachlamydiaceae bacterium]